MWTDSERMEVRDELLSDFDGDETVVDLFLLEIESEYPWLAKRVDLLSKEEKESYAEVLLDVLCR